MGYDLFAPFYDASTEHLYRRGRVEAVASLGLAPDAVVVDAPVGTGQSLPMLLDAVPEGRILGLDLSEGMLRRAARRAEKHGGAERVLTRVADLTRVDESVLEALGCPDGVDAVHTFLGLSVVPEPARVVERLWALLRPGGRLVMVDTYAEKPGLQGRMVQWTAGADLTRRSWEWLQAMPGAGDFRRWTIPASWQVGGELWGAVATRVAVPEQR